MNLLKSLLGSISIISYVAANSAAAQTAPAGNGRAPASTAKEQPAVGTASKKSFPSVQLDGWVEAFTLALVSYNKNGSVKSSKPFTYYELHSGDGQEYLLSFIYQNTVGTRVVLGKSNVYTIKGELAPLPSTVPPEYETFKSVLASDKISNQIFVRTMQLKADKP